MKIRLAASLQSDSFLDGAGIRTVIWTQGCVHNCLGCHNPETHDFNGGKLFDVEEVKQQIAAITNQDGITFSGGDPMCQIDACANIAKYVKSKGLNVWCYTGYTFEQLIEMSKKNKKILDFLNNIDVLVDGKFVLSERSLDLFFRGSKNQRVIDVKKSLEQNKAIIIDKYMKPKEFKNKIEKEEHIYI